MWFKVWGSFFGGFLSSTLVRHPCFLWTFSLTNVLQLAVSSLLHTSTSATPSEHQGVKACVWSSESLAPVSTRRSAGAPLRTEGHRDNYKTMSRWIASPACRALKLPPFPRSQALPPPFHPSPQTTDTGDWRPQATPPWRELPLGNSGKGVQPGENV